MWLKKSQPDYKMKENSNHRIRVERFFIVLIYLFVAISLIPFFWICWDLLSKGLSYINLSFFTEAMPDKTTLYLLRESREDSPGGIVHALLGSIYIAFIALAVSLPISLGAGIYMHNKKDKWISKMLDSVCRILSGTPSLIIGIVIYFWIVIPLHGFSALAGGIALSIILVPLITLFIFQSLNQIPLIYKEAGIALGGDIIKVVGYILLPMASRNIKSGILFSIANSLGETAPLLFTALGASLINWNITEPTSSLTLLIWEIFQTPRLSELLWAASLVLFIITLLFNMLASKYQEPKKKNS